MLPQLEEDQVTHFQRVRNSHETMIDIAITNRQQLLSLDRPLLSRACRAVVEGTGHPQAELSLVVVDDPQMHTLNRQHLAHDYPTDVLSFCLSSPGEPLVGEVIASAATAISNASEFGTLPGDELLLYFIHGTLHLVGYTDKSPNDAAAMRQAEAHWLTAAGVPAERIEPLVFPHPTSVNPGEPAR